MTEAKSEYEVASPIRWGGKDYAVGEPISLTDTQAEDPSFAKRIKKPGSKGSASIADAQNVAGAKADLKAAKAERVKAEEDRTAAAADLEAAKKEREVAAADLEAAKKERAEAEKALEDAKKAASKGGKNGGTSSQK